MSNSQIEDPVPNQTTQSTLWKPLRLWPGVIAAILLALAWVVVPFLIPEATLYGMMASGIAILAIFVWWVFFSRAPWLVRLGAILLMAVALFATYRLIHISLVNGAMGFLFYVLAVPVLCLGLVAWAVASRRLPNKHRLTSLVAMIVLVCLAFTLLRTGGITGYANSDWHWRWSKTPEERLLAQAGDEPMSPPAAPVNVKTGAEWPGFRGPNRDGLVRGVRINTDWNAAPPVALWRRPIGPAWSSFAVSGDLIYTQEQRGNQETVSCYNMTTGKPVWRHGDSARFWESNAGAGPRATPTLSNGRVYTLGGTGILNALDASNGSVIWSRNAATDTKAKLPAWGFAASPLVVNDVVIVATAGTLAAYDIANGQPRWIGEDGGSGYSSPQLMTINGVSQVVLLGGKGALGVAPGDGKRLWEYALPSGGRIVQPGQTPDGDLLTHDGESTNMRRVSITSGTSGWTTAERWLSEGLKPYFSDFVVHNGYAFGFDGSSIACIDLKDGQAKWKGGRYGNGQLVMLPDQDLLLVLSEEGELALVKATPDKFSELARFTAIEGKTWNHPVLVGDTLLVRNAEEMAAFRLARL